MKHISYFTSVLYGLLFIPFLAGLWWVWNVIPVLFVIFGVWVLILAMCSGTFMVISKGHAMWHIDMHGVKQVARRSSRTEPK